MCFDSSANLLSEDGGYEDVAYGKPADPATLGAVQCTVYANDKVSPALRSDEPLCLRN